ncbi:MAG: cadherin-like beta sandwich domain-containing protein [Oscillospiraceae bacterium]|nr:cadherin-like beta sandwich domain-containing protein [Oscillospiraceae bacterium]
MKRAICLSGILLLLLLCLGLWTCRPVSAAEAPSISLSLTADPMPAARGKTCRVTARFQSSRPTSLLAFRLRLSYAASDLTLVKMEGPSGADSDTFQARYTASGAKAVFASAGQTVSTDGGICCTLVFDVNEDAAVGSSELQITVDQMVDDQLEKISDPCTGTLPLEMERLLSGDALLTKLIPSDGVLTPNFSPEVTEYTLSVPFSVRSLSFATEAKDGGTIRINRKNLKGAGVPTTFTIQVTAENGKASTTYVVTATRQEQESSSSTSSAMGSANTSKNSMGITTSHSSASSYPASKHTASASATSGSSKASSNSEGSTQEKAKADDAAGTTHDTEEKNGAGGNVTLYGNRNVYYGNEPFASYLIGGLVVLCIILLLILVLLLLRLGRRSHKDPYKPRH